MKLIGSKQFYKKTLSIAIPITIQSAITQFVNMLDNIMVGRVGTEQMSGVSIVNQLMFVFMLCIFGAMSGVGIFSAQFYGRNDIDGLRNSFRLKTIIALIIAAAGIALFWLFGDDLVLLWLQSEEEKLDIALVISSAHDYFRVMLIGIIPFALANVYATTLRETSQTIVPMVSGIAAVILNLTFNYFLIYGECGFPELGVKGAAIATVMSRFLEMGILMFWTHKHKQRNTFIVDVFRNFKIPGKLVKDIAKRGWPLVVNETLWSAGIAVLNQCYSLRGVSVVAAMNITTTLTNVMNVTFISMGNAIGIILGQLLGAKKFEEARDSSGKLVAFSVFIGFLSGAVLFALSGLFPQVYNTDNEVRQLAGSFIMVFGVWFCIDAFINASYFVIRSGGKTFVTFLFDSCFVWVVSVPIAFCLGHFTGLSSLWMLIIVQTADIIKCIAGYILIKKGVWINNIVE